MKKKVDISAILQAGTAKQKALLITRNSTEEVMGRSLLSESEVKAIYASITSERDIKTFNRYLEISRTIQDFRFRLYGALKEYQEKTGKINYMCGVWDEDLRQIGIYNEILYLFRNTSVKNRKALLTLRLFFQNIADEPKNARMGFNLDGNLELDEYEIIGLLKTLRESAENSLSVLKAICITIERYVEKNKAKSFLPEDMKRLIAEAKKDQSPSELYSRVHYNKLVKEGNIKDAVFYEKYAVFPDYEEVEPYELMMKVAKERFGI